MNQYKQKCTVFNCVPKETLMLHRWIVFTLLEQFVRDLFSKHPQKVFRDYMIEQVEKLILAKMGSHWFNLT